MLNYLYFNFLLFFSSFSSLLFLFSLLLYCSGAQVLSCILDPLLQLCTVSASNLGTADMATYMVNSLYMMKTTLALFEFTDKRLEMLEFQVRCIHNVFKASEFFLHQYIHWRYNNPFIHSRPPIYRRSNTRPFHVLNPLPYEARTKRNR